MSNESALALATSPTTNPTPSPSIPSVPVPQSTEVVTTKPQDLESTRFTQLAKKEQAIFKEREAFKLEKESFLKERDALVGADKRLKEFQELKARDPIAAMKFAEFTDTDILNYFASLEDKSTPEEKAVKATQAELKKFTDLQAQKEAEVIDKRNKEAVEKFRSNISTHLEKGREELKYCNFYGPIAEELIFETTSQILADTNELVNVDEVAKMVEEYYEGIDTQMESIRKKPVKEAVADAKAQIEQLRPEVSPGQPNTMRTRTLSNRATATSSASVPRQESKEEKRERLIQKLASLAK